MKHTASAIIQLQSLPLFYQVERSKRLIHEAMQHFNYKMAVSFSGGKDSTVLLHLVRSLYPEVPAVFIDTGLEYPEIRSFIKTLDNVTIIKPKMKFREVIEKYGYPVISKEVSQWLSEIATTHSDKLRRKRIGQLPIKWRFMLNAPFKISNRCCDIMKKNPAHEYTKKTGKHFFVGTMSQDSAFRMQSAMLHGCNAFDIDEPKSRPLTMWKDHHIHEYIYKNNVDISPIYSMGYEHTGCMFCMFGLHMESYPNRFERMRETHPKIYRYCMEDLGLQKVMEWYPKRGYMPQERMFA